MSGRCKDCRFSRKRMQFNTLNLLCMAEPPKNMPIPQPNNTIMFIAIWPCVEDDAWCGKFEPDPRGLS